MKHVIIASQNPVKIGAGQDAFTSMFPHDIFTFTGCAAQSGVSEQPMSSDETLRGARSRLAHAHTLYPDADYWIAFEGGVEDIGHKMTSVIWVCAADKNGQSGQSRCVTFELPPQIADLIRGGMTLGDADDMVFKRENSKQKNGAIGILTHDVLTRRSVYAQGGVMALIPLRNPELYSSKTEENVSMPVSIAS